MESLNVLSPEFRADPYPHLKRTREAGPACRIEPQGFIGFTHYDEIAGILKDPKRFSSTEIEMANRGPVSSRIPFNRSVLLGSDPPEHTRVRRMIQKAFLPREMDVWKPRVEKIAQNLISELAASQPTEFDLIRDVATPIPVTVIALILGVEEKRLRDFKRWSDDIISIRAVDYATNLEWRNKREEELIRSYREFNDYFDVAIRDRMAKPRDDLLSLIVHAGEQGEVIRADDVLGLARLMLIAGNETTTNLIGNAINALLKNPEQWNQLKEDPELAASALEESLRYDSPVLFLHRRVTEDLEFAGQSLKADTIVMPMLASANRDPRHFPDPDRFDIKREARSHLAFGSGIHLCVGAPLARIETRVVLKCLAREFPDLQLTDAPTEWLDSLFLRGRRSLILRTQAPHAASRPRPQDPSPPALGPGSPPFI